MDIIELGAHFYRALARGLGRRLRETNREVAFLKGFVQTHHGPG